MDRRDPEKIRQRGLERDLFETRGELNRLLNENRELKEIIDELVRNSIAKDVNITDVIEKARKLIKS